MNEKKLCTVTLDCDDVFSMLLTDDQIKVFNFFKKQGYEVDVRIIDKPIEL